ncbi:MAG: hydantoin utilization protein B [Chromatiales bacterium]|jgi:N-methylhydantoinase B|nr:hydantoin utilization protein B [Chromatiales bacterium]
MSLDVVTLKIFANHCAAATESMARTLVRTAHSTFVKETEDFTTGLATPDGQTFASPYSLGATWFVGLDYKRVIDVFDDYRDGDICLTNDPYSGFVCTHSPDVHLWKPIFFKGELICFAVGHVHNTDVGGAVPASLSRANVDVHQEGIRIPPQRLYREGKLNQDLVDILLLNVRMPEQNWGDLNAQIAAMRTGEKKVLEMVERFGIEAFKSGMYDLLEHAERHARHLNAKIPDGEYFFADYMDEDSVDGKPCRIAVNLIVKGEDVVFDYSLTDPQLNSSLNIPTGGNTRHALLMIPYVYMLYTMDSSVLLNCGLLRAARCILPEGSLVNPEFPAAVGMRSLGVNRLQSTVFGAFAQALPDLTPAAPGDGGPLINVRTADPVTGRRLMANLNPITGGAGALASRDGTEGSGGNHGFLKNTPIEISEAEVPVKILRYGLARDSAGPGRWRGGTSTSLRFKAFSPHTVVTARNRDRSTFTGWGLAGGRAGAASSFVLNPDTNRAKVLGNTDVVTMDPGDVIEITSAGAGGYGDPLERNPELVAKDVAAGFVSPGAAEQDYAVVLNGGEIDERATNALRERRRGSSPRNQANQFSFSDAQAAFESRWTLRNYAAMVEVMNALPVQWRFFIKHRLFDALDAQSSTTQRDDGSDVFDAFTVIAAEFPQLGNIRVASTSD